MLNVEIGSKIKFKSEKQRYTVMAHDARFVIAIKPFNLKKTYIYTIIDLKDKKRSSDNYYCRFDYNSTIECNEALKMLNETANNLGSHGFWLSYRQVIDLDIEKIY